MKNEGTQTAGEGPRHHSLVEVDQGQATSALKLSCERCGAGFETIDLGRFTRTTCPVCSEIVRQRADVRQRREQRTLILGNAIRRAVPPDFRHARLARVPERLRDVLSGLARNESLYLWGSVGGGKTYAIAALVRDIVLRSRGEVSVRRVTHAGLDQQVRATFTPGSERSEAGVLREYMASDVLWIEDIGSGVTPSDFTSRILEAVVDGRLEQCRPTFATSNLSVEQIEAAFGERIGSRLCRYRVVKLNGRDRRKVGQQGVTNQDQS